jgi:hypothetical protein
VKEIVGPGESPRDLAAKEIVGVEDSGAEALVPRDQWDRPLILPREGHKAACKPRKGKGGGCTCMKGYTRVSGLAETLSDTFGLGRYQQGNVVKGLVAQPSLLNAARGVRNKGELYEIVDLAQTIGDDKGAARNGSAFHRMVEDAYGGADMTGYPDNMLAMLDVFQKEMLRHGFTPTEFEQFVVQDTVEAAGTFDQKVDQYIGDVKTGQNLSYLVLKTTLQVALYAASEHYDIGTFERLPLGVDRDRGLLLWCPWVEDPKDAHCEIRWLDLKGVGRPGVLLAKRIKEMRKLTPEQIAPRVR